MNIHMNLFCLIVALATSITDGRISSSSSSQPVGGSAVDMNPNRRVLEPAGVDSETQYCKATPVGKQRSVVDWQEHDQCRMCEVGQTYWPCDGDNLCEGHCTPEAVCNERLRLASDCTAVNAEKDDLEAELEGFGAIIAEKDGEITDLKETATTVNAEMVTLVEQLASDATTTTTLIESLRVKNDAMIADRDKEITDLKETATTVNAEMVFLKTRIVELVEFEASSAATIESLKASTEQKDPMIAELSLKDDTDVSTIVDLLAKDSTETIADLIANDSNIARPEGVCQYKCVASYRLGTSDPGFIFSRCCCGYINDVAKAYPNGCINPSNLATPTGLPQG
ncbi:hypothetical protein FRACYDRAFT_257201 [Fragilariopsis cylindrus CCMP1102]|uniref:Uncharacterized protein n=1 Tax=Fragilariopsis cylindrus CCMP1102 TaxID=635003 RepID=A0A1E7EJ71_9STRA|nr:hypothetical protein FRACYDRAFT_257201 [Fragilariopsis cylindrus CCMP1102]|eukprot:OEU05958.1 hypothetical protein FRACYDRAFT_257201 [Fragilariopsis cylindrus CCMP1102]